VLAENAILLKGAEGSQIMGSQYKEVSPEDNRDCQPSKKAKEKQPARYCGDIGVKMGMLTSVRGVCTLGRTTWYTIQDE